MHRNVQDRLACACTSGARIDQSVELVERQILSKGRRAPWVGFECAHAATRYTGGRDREDPDMSADIHEVPASRSQDAPKNPQLEEIDRSDEVVAMKRLRQIQPQAHPARQRDCSRSLGRDGH